MSSSSVSLPLTSPGERHADTHVMRAPGGTLWGYPKGVFLLSFTELWERFSYFGMLAILVLFLTTTLDQGGFGWERTQALKLYGFYTGLIFSAPLLGGWIANNYWGERRCILVGGLLLVAGHACLAGPAVLPWIAQQWAAVDYRALWVEAGVPLGALFPSAAEQARLAAVASANGVSTEALTALYRGIALSFFGGLALIASGTALLKPTISSIIGRFFAQGDKRRDAAFALFFVGIYIGSLSASFVVGFLGERVAWHWGFTAAGFGMALGLVAYLWKQHQYLADLGIAPVRANRAGGKLRRLGAQERDRIKVIFLQGLFTVVYAAAFYQKGGLLTLFAREHLDRQAGGWEIPVTWLLTISTGTFILVTPALARFWQRLEERGRNPGASVKLAWGLVALGVGYSIIAAAFWDATGDAVSVGGVAGAVPNASASAAVVSAGVWWGWLVLTYICFGIGDSLVWPTQISLVSKLAPRELSAVFVGGWYITIGIGSWMTGYIGALGYSWGMQALFVALAASTIFLGGILWAITPRLKRMMHGAE